MIGRDAARRWLEARPGAPPVLRERMLEALALEAAGGPTVQAGAGASRRSRGRRPGPGRPPAAAPPATAVQLAEAALDCLRAALAAGRGRPAAVHLLAADALLTYACEAAAEAGPDALLALAREYGPGRLARLLPAGRREGHEEPAGR